MRLSLSLLATVGEARAARLLVRVGDRRKVASPGGTSRYRGGRSCGRRAGDTRVWPTAESQGVIVPMTGATSIVEFELVKAD